MCYKQSWPDKNRKSETQTLLSERNSEKKELEKKIVVKI